MTEAASVNGTEDDLLTAFLDHVSLVADLDTWEADRGVSVMTLHSAKGLEFGVVAVGGLEDGLLPHFNAQGAREDIEEERRLLYVGMTRAQDRLLLSSCRRRRVAGRYQDQMQSPFVAEIPAELLRVTESPTLFPDTRGQGVYRFFGRAGEASPSVAAVPFGRRVADALEETTRRALRRGSRVRHASLGEGVVLELEGEGDQLKVTVFFKNAGKRKMVAKYASLDVL
jgi:DNA helicase-2/ATP-dependent DNA helicase PcrA